MKSMRFTWDERKSRQNKKKHKVSFGEAQTTFYDENARLISDPDHSDDEDRFILLGISIKLRVLVVCHCYRDKESLVRIISARKANKKEQKNYTRYL